MNTFLYALFILAVLILAAILYLATRPKRPAEFDGGWTALNDVPEPPHNPKG